MHFHVQLFIKINKKQVKVQFRDKHVTHQIMNTKCFWCFITANPSPKQKITHSKSGMINQMIWSIDCIRDSNTTLWSAGFRVKHDASEMSNCSAFYNHWKHDDMTCLSKNKLSKLLLCFSTVEKEKKNSIQYFNTSIHRCWKGFWQNRLDILQVRLLVRIWKNM